MWSLATAYNRKLTPYISLLPINMATWIPSLRLHGACTILRAIPVIGANDIPINLSFYIHSVGVLVHIPASVKGRNRILEREEEKE